MSGLLFDTPYQSTYASQIGNQLIPVYFPAAPGLVFGWNYHNEGDSTLYAKFYDADSSFSDPTSITPKLRVGMPPEQSSGNILCVGGIPFETGIWVAVMSSIADGTYDDFDWAWSMTTFFIPEADL